MYYKLLWCVVTAVLLGMLGITTIMREYPGYLFGGGGDGAVRIIVGTVIAVFTYWAFSPLWRGPSKKDMEDMYK